jgi:hypothetical protein
MWTLNRDAAMAKYQVEVKFSGPNAPIEGIWLPVARSSTEEGAREYVQMWERSGYEAKNIVGIRVMKDRKEVKL